MKCKLVMISIVGALVAASCTLGSLAAAKVSAAEQTTREVRPVAEYTFDNSVGDGWLNNSGSWGAEYNLQKSNLAKRENWGANSGGVNFSDDSCVYLTGDKYIFNELDEFTVCVDFYAERNANWYSSLLSWDVLDASGFTNMSRFSIGYQTGQDWLKFSSVDILGSMAKEGTEYGAYFKKGESLLSKNVNSANSGWWKFYYSVKPGGTAITLLTTGTSNVNYVKVFNVPEDFSLKNENGAFSVGASFKNASLGLEWKANGVLDNLRIYDFAMTESQLIELRWTNKICESDVVIASTQNGTLTANKQTALNGELVLFDVQPNAGYEVDKVFVNDMEIAPLDGIYYTHMTKAGMVVTATFKEIAAGADGSSQSGEASANGCASSVVGAGLSGALLLVAAVGLMRKKEEK